MRILVLEDDPLIATMLADWLEELGHEVTGPAATAAEALALADGGAIDAALLDLHLREGDSRGVAEHLRTGGVPFAFVTGDGVDGLPPGFRDRPFLAKPFGFESVEALLRGWE